MVTKKGSQNTRVRQKGNLNITLPDEGEPHSRRINPDISVSADVFEDDDYEIPSQSDYNGTLNKRLKEIDVEACGGRYGSKDRVPKDPYFFSRVTGAADIKDKLLLAFRLPRELESWDGQWICPGRRCDVTASKIENLYLHIAHSDAGHEELKPVVRQSFCRPCRQFCKNPAGVLAHEMSHSVESGCYERRRLTRLLRILGDDQFESHPPCKRKKEEKKQDSDDNRVRKIVSRSRSFGRRRGRSRRASQSAPRRQRRPVSEYPVPSADTGTIYRSGSLPGRPYHDVLERYLKDPNPKADGGVPQALPGEPTTVTWSVPAQEVSDTALDPELLISAPSPQPPKHRKGSVIPKSSAIKENAFVDKDSADTTVQDEVRTMFCGRTASTVTDLLHSGEADPRSCFDEMLRPVADYIVDQRSTMQPCEDDVGFNESAAPFYLSSGVSWDKTSTCDSGPSRQVSRHESSPWRMSGSRHATLPSYARDFDDHKQDQDLDVSRRQMASAQDSLCENELNEHGCLESEDNVSVLTWPAVNTIGNQQM